MAVFYLVLGFASAVVCGGLAFSVTASLFLAVLAYGAGGALALLAVLANAARGPEPTLAEDPFLFPAE